MQSGLKTVDPIDTTLYLHIKWDSTRRPVSSRNGCERVTVRCARYDLPPEAREDLKANLGNSEVSKVLLPLVWVDTVGLDDADLQGNYYLCDHFSVIM